MFRKRAFMLFVLIITSFTLMTGGCGSDSPEYPFSTLNGDWYASSGNGSAVYNGTSYTLKLVSGYGRIAADTYDFDNDEGNITISYSTFFWDMYNGSSPIEGDLNGYLLLKRVGKNQYWFKGTINSASSSTEIEVTIRILSPDHLMVDYYLKDGDEILDVSFELRRHPGLPT